MGLKKRRKAPFLNPNLLRAAFEFDRLHLWEILDFDQVVAFIVPGEEHPVFATVMGQAGEEFGMTFAIGPHALWNQRQLLYPQHSEKRIREMVSIWGLTLTRQKDLPPEIKRAMKSSRVKRPTGAKVPWVIIKEAGKHARTPNKREQEIILYCMTGLMKHYKSEGEPPLRLEDANQVLTLTLSGEPKDPEIQTTVRAYAIVAPDDSTTPTHLPPDAVCNAARINGTWIVGFPVVPARIEGDERELRMLLIVDADSGLLLHMDTLFGDDFPRAVNGFFDLASGKTRGPGKIGKIHGLPDEILFADESLQEALGPALKVLNVSFRFDDEHPSWTEAVEGLAKFLGRGKNATPAR